MNRYARALACWVASFLACALLAAMAFAWWDVPLAGFLWPAGRSLNMLGDAFGSTLLLAGETAVVLSLVVARLVRGHLSPLGKALALACLASMCAYVVNDALFKPLFGVPTPAQVLQGARHAVALATGSWQGSFPSGHMVMAGGFAGVFMRLYRCSRWPMAGLLLLGAGLLLVGDWHFLSDIIAGTFIGITAGLLAGEAWRVHSAVHTAQA